ncbi:hypothetical protein FCMLKIFP_00083 [Pseudomonas phage Ka3]|nr:hypothetical protein [Pseudomonas phage vB_Pae-PA152]WQZ52433.1 hypothetical protein FCMLKIFP_00083 [Pseudomonas phage Ka3]
MSNYENGDLIFFTNASGQMECKLILDGKISKFLEGNPELEGIWNFDLQAKRWFWGFLDKKKDNAVTFDHAFVDPPTIGAPDVWHSVPKEVRLMKTLTIENIANMQAE